MSFPDLPSKCSVIEPAKLTPDQFICALSPLRHSTWRLHAYPLNVDRNSITYSVGPSPVWTKVELTGLDADARVDVDA